MSLTCKYCDNKFTKIYNLNRHSNEGYCMVQKTPKLLMEYVKKQEELLQKIQEQNEKIQKQNITIMDEIKELKNKPQIKTHIQGNNNTVQNIIIMGDVYSLQQTDIKYLVDKFMESGDSNDIMKKFMKLYKYNKLFEAMILETLHNNPKYKDMQNLLYCHHGKHVGKFMSYKQPEWIISNISSIIEVIQTEMNLFVEQVEDLEYSDDSEHRNNFTSRSKNLSKYSDFISDIIKEFIKSKSKTYPKVKKEEPSERVKRDKQINRNPFD